MEEKYNRILIVEDDPAMAGMLSDFLSERGYLINVAHDGKDAIDLVKKDDYDIILSDVVMPSLNGIALLKRLKKEKNEAIVIMMSAYGTIDSAVEAMRLGAYDYISKPFKLDEVILTLNKARESRILRDENIRLKKELEGKYKFHDIISKNNKMREIFETIRKVSAYPTGILIMGESGTGKELIARAIHYESRLKEGPFVPVNLAAFPENLLESELFGYVKGAFTDATMNKPGLFEEAHNGTLFLDEVGELPLSLQVKLLRALQEGEIRRLGATAPTRVEVRIISATARELEGEVRDGRFRDDLFYRLNVISLKIPPLRERKEDIPTLVQHFMNRFNEKLELNIEMVDKDALGRLMNYPWPGNVRELENCMERAMILSDGNRIKIADLPIEVVTGENTLTRNNDDPSTNRLSIKEAKKDMEKRLITEAIEKSGRNLTKAAQILEISYRTLLYKLKDYDISR